MSEHLAESVALTIEDAKEHGCGRVAVSVGLLEATLEKLNEHASLTEKVERYNKILGAYRRFAALVLDFAINFGELRTTGEQNKQIRNLESVARLNTQAANDWTALLESE